MSPGPSGRFSPPLIDAPRVLIRRGVPRIDHLAAVDQRGGSFLHDENIRLRIVHFGLAAALPVGHQQGVIAVVADLRVGELLRVQFARQLLAHGREFRSLPHLHGLRRRGQRGGGDNRDCVTHKESFQNQSVGSTPPKRGTIFSTGMRFSAGGSAGKSVNGSLWYQ